MELTSRPVVWVLLISLTSCAYQSQVIRLNPALPSLQESSATSGNHEVFLITQDARPTEEIGRRAQGTSHEAPITTNSDVAGVLQSQMTEILKAKGFTVITAKTSEMPTLEVHLKELTYHAAMVTGQRTVKIHVVLETIVKNGLKTSTNLYKAQQERKIVLEPVARSNEEWINEAFSLALVQLAEDPALFARLN